MILEFSIGSNKYNIDTSKLLRISIPLDFHGEQPNAFGVPKASAEAVRAGKLIGDTRLGGSCNFERVAFIPHCNSTHTECVGHIADERISIHTIISQSLFPATLISVSPENASKTVESYLPDKGEPDKLITHKVLSPALENGVPGFLDALIIRTLPNDESKLVRNYTISPPPFFSIEAMEYITRLNVQHLLVDVPSLDRMNDRGKLTAHRIFWHLEPGTHNISASVCSSRTVTEMIFVPNEIADGLYMLDLQIANFIGDASPSNPIIYKVNAI
jgi:arylformamidase